MSNPSHVVVGRAGKAGSSFFDALVENLQQFRSRRRDAEFESGFEFPQLAVKRELWPGRQLRDMSGKPLLLMRLVGAVRVIEGDALEELASVFHFVFIVKGDGLAGSHGQTIAAIEDSFRP
jgi:hypothetical protein